MAANCLIYRRCRANAINKPLYREDSFVSMSIVFPVVRIRIRLERKKYTTLSLSLYNALPRLLLFFRSVQHRASTFIRFVSCTRIPPSRAKFYSFAAILRHSNAAPPTPSSRRKDEARKVKLEKRMIDSCKYFIPESV